MTTEGPEEEAHEGDHGADRDHREGTATAVTGIRGSEVLRRTAIETRGDEWKQVESWHWHRPKYKRFQTLHASAYLKYLTQVLPCCCTSPIAAAAVL